jgi:hypothetical protein
VQRKRLVPPSVPVLKTHRARARGRRRGQRLAHGRAHAVGAHDEVKGRPSYIVAEVTKPKLQKSASKSRVLKAKKSVPVEQDLLI